MEVSIKPRQIKIVLGVLALILVVVVAAGVWGTRQNAGTDTTPAATAEVLENGTQVIQIQAKVGYSPGVVQAKAGVPTTLKIVTNNTYDCSLALTIPKLGFNKMLPYSGTTAIDIPAQTAGSEIIGVCTMGMYRFQLLFI